MKTSTKDSYFKRIDRVVGFLSDQVDQSPSLEDLADVAAISPFHFHRVYRAVTGETPSGTLRRLRLAKACGLLQATEKPVTEIAFDVGYDTSQSLAKALKDVTGHSASELRADRELLGTILKALSTAPGNEDTPADLNVKVVSTAPFKVIASRHVGAPEKLFMAYGEFFNWAERTGLAESLQGIYGIPIDDPRQENQDAIRFDACFDFGAEAKAEAPYAARQLGGGLYAVVRHVGLYEGLDAYYDYLYGPWLEASGYRLREAPAYNNYIQDPETVPPEEWETDIYIPIEEGEQS